MTPKIFQNSAFEDGFDRSGRLSHTGSFEFEREFGKRVWFAAGTGNEVHDDHTPYSPGGRAISHMDGQDRGSIESAADKYGESIGSKNFSYSYNGLLTWAGNEKLSAKQAMNPKDVAQFLVRQLSREAELSTYQNLLLRTLKLIQNGSRMTEDLNLVFKELEDEFSGALTGKFLGSELEQKEKEELLFALRDLQIVGPFTANDDRTEESRGTKKKDLKDYLLDKDPTNGQATFDTLKAEYQALTAKKQAKSDATAEMGSVLKSEQELKDKLTAAEASDKPTIQTELDAIIVRKTTLETNITAYTSNDEHMIEVYSLLFNSPRGMTSGLFRELEGLKAQAFLTPDEQKLKDALTYLQELKPYFDNGGPVDKTRLSTDRLAAIDRRVFQLAVQSENLSAQEQRLIVQLQDKNFHGTGLTTQALLNAANYDPNKFDLKFMQNEVLKGHAQNMPTEAELMQAADELAHIALTVKTLQEKVRIQMQLGESVLGAVDERREMRPRQHIGRQIKGKLRRIRYGVETAFAKDPNKGIAALVAGIGVLGWVLTSKNPKMGAFRKAMIYGGLGIYGVYGGDLWVKALTGKSPIEEVEKLTSMDAHRLDDNLRRIFSDYATNEKEIENFEILIGVTKDIPFMELWDRYQQVKKSSAKPKKLNIPGVLNPNLIEGMDNDQAFYEAMAMFDRRYGKFIDEYENDKGIVALAGMTMLEVTKLLVSVNNDSRAQKQPFYYLANMFGHGFDGATSLGGKVIDRLHGYIGNWIGGNKYRLVNYLREILPSADYGFDIGMPNKTENIVTLPGGVMTKVRFLYGTKVQDYKPGERIDGFVFYNVDGSEKIFHFGENNPEEIMGFAKGLVRDTALKTMPQIKDNAEDKKLMEDFYHQASKTLEWNQSEMKWMVPGFKVEPKPIEINADDMKHTLTIPTSFHNIYIKPYGPLDKATFGIRFYQNDKYWDKEKAALDTAGSLTKLTEKIEKDNFKSWILRSYHFPFATDDIEIENWSQIKDGTATSINGIVTRGTSRTVTFKGEFTDVTGGTPQQGIEVRDAASRDKVASTSSGWAGANSELVFTFDVKGYTTSEKENAWRDVLTDVVNTRFDNMISLASEMNERWFKNLFPLKFPWKYFKDFKNGGSVSEEEWTNLLTTRRDLLIQQIESGDMSQSQLSNLNDVLIELAKFEEKVQRDIALNKEVDNSTFDNFALELETLGYPDEFIAEYSYFKSRMERFYDFEPEAFRDLMDLFQKQALKKDRTGRTAMDVLTNGNPTDKANAQKFLHYYVEKMTTHFNKAKMGGMFAQIDTADVQSLERSITVDESQQPSRDTIRTSGGDVTLGQGSYEWPTFDEYINANTNDRMRFDFVNTVYDVQRMWLQHTDLVTAPLLSKIKWQPFGFQYHNWGTLDTRLIAGTPPSLPLDSAGKYDATKGSWGSLELPLLRGSLARVFDFEHYDIVWRTLDAVGLYPPGLAGALAFPDPRRGVNNFKSEAAIYIDQFIATNTAPSVVNTLGTAGAGDVLLETLNTNMENAFVRNLNSNLIGSRLITTLNTLP
ncbi:MAG: hypothetical protein Q8P68_03570 [Candidatus Peregrinibacteria bacterium]|nr:hypothetical protein [Candidatus Peregrinibacteria bacterium]MDZ4245320.1 hypothetical protein [Candidatus Gracilibacteria bacterium]